MSAPVSSLLYQLRQVWRGLFLLPLCCLALPAVADPPQAVIPPGLAERFSTYDVVAVPDKDLPEWWAGAPSVVLAPDGVFWMAVRMRMADAPLGERGYEIRILRSEDGIHFERAAALHREDVPLPGFERPALVIDPATGKFKLYACGRLNGPWCIFKFDDADSPTEFRAETARAVISPLAEPTPDPNQIVGEYHRPAPVPDGYKDPVIIHAGGRWHCFVIGTLRSERTFHFESSDGEAWEPVGNPSQSLLDLSGWHDFAVRPASVLPLGVGYLFVYEGSSAQWEDPVYNIATGLGFSLDLSSVTDLTPQAPLLVSPTPGRLHAWRYSHWMWVKDQLWIYAEVERPNGSHEVRLFRLPRA